MNAYQQGRLARRMGLFLLALPDGMRSWRDVVAYEHGYDDEDDTLRTGVDDIQAAYVADRLAERRAAEEQRFADWVRSQSVAG